MSAPNGGRRSASSAERLSSSNIVQAIRLPSSCAIGRDIKIDIESGIDRTKIDLGVRPTAATMIAAPATAPIVEMDHAADASASGSDRGCAHVPHEQGRTEMLHEKARPIQRCPHNRTPPPRVQALGPPSVQVIIRIGRTRWRRCAQMMPSLSRSFSRCERARATCAAHRGANRDRVDPARSSRISTTGFQRVHRICRHRHRAELPIAHLRHELPRDNQWAD